MTVADTACTAKRQVIAVRDTPLTGRAGWGREWRDCRAQLLRSGE